jgi:hypothetical protein
MGVVDSYELRGLDWCVAGLLSVSLPVLLLCASERDHDLFSVLAPILRGGAWILFLITLVWLVIRLFRPIPFDGAAGTIHYNLPIMLLVGALYLTLASVLRRKSRS